MRQQSKGQKEDICLDDKEIIRLFFERNEGAIKETDKKYGKYLYTVANNVLESPEDSEECVNDTYVKAWNAIPPTVPRVLRAFLSKIARNLAINKYESENRRISITKGSADSLSDFEGFISDACTFEDRVTSADIADIISGYLKGVSNQKLYIFVSRYYHAESVESIAKKLGVTSSSVYKTLNTMKIELRRLFDERGIKI